MEKSLWIESAKAKRYSRLEKEENTDICIIGGGLTGLTCAYYLSKAGKKVVLLEKNTIGSHASGNTTGKITSGHGLIYNYLINSVGEGLAKQYLEANEEAIKNIKKIIEEENIECDFEETSNYIFTQDEQYVDKIKEEVEAINKLGHKAEFVNNIDIPVKEKENNKLVEEIVGKKENDIKIKRPILGAVKLDNQAMFNSYKYMLGLADAIEKNGGIIYETSKVIEVKKEENYKIRTEEGVVNADFVVLASHYPIINFPGFYFLKMYQETSYLIAAETSKEIFEGMYINAEEPAISLRTAMYNGKKIFLVGGMTHKTGAKIDLKDSYNKLEKIAKSLYPDCKVLFRWSTEDCVSLDKIPYIGEFSNMMPNLYVATGYKKWGMTTSNVAANIICNKILNKENKYEEVFNSKRLKPIKNYKELGNLLKEVSYSLVINKLRDSKEYLNNVEKDEGKIIEIDNKKVGVYRDKEGNVYAVKPYCTHLGCELSWNNLDRTWDCPCHGSKFNYEGKNIYDPAIKDLEMLNIFD